VQTEDSLSSGARIPFALIADLQREYLKQLWRFWNATFLSTFAGGAHFGHRAGSGRQAVSRMHSWREQPYYDLLKQSYLLGSRQLHEFVDRPGRRQDQDCSFGLCPAVYRRDESSNFQRPNPEVIRKAIETRAASLTDGIKNLIDDLQKGRITRVDESAFEVGRNLATTPGR